MQKIFHLLSISAALIFLAACKKDETQLVLKKGVFSSSGLTASTTTLVLDSSQAASNAVTFNWPAVNAGNSVLVTYTLEFDVPTDSFKSATSVLVGVGALTKTYSVADFNALVYQSLAMPAGTAGTVLVRARADVNQANGASSTVPSSYSDTLAMTVTPYPIIVVYPALWAPGAYQNWSPATAPTLASVKSDGNYEGYVYFPAGGTLFKLTSSADWNHTNYGDGGNGTLSTSGGNLIVSAGGYYRIEASTKALTWSATATTWAIIGNAPVASNNWASDVPMTYNSSTGTWTVTTACVAGTFKFRANGDWNNPLNNFGDDSPPTGKPVYNDPTNISITAPGTYTFTLDLSHAGNYLYTVKKN